MAPVTQSLTMNFVRTLTLRQLQIFVVAARNLSYARAAEELAEVRAQVPALANRRTIAKS